MSQSEEKPIDESIKQGEGSGSFLFVNIEENIKKEVVEEEEEKEHEEKEGRDYTNGTLQQDLKTETEIAGENHIYVSEREDEDSTLDSLDNDVNSTNIGQAFTCDHCSISFVSLAYLEVHISRCRAKTPAQTEDDNNTSKRPRARAERKHRCETCGRGFFSATALEKHRRSHAIFKCDKCEYATNVRSNLRKHAVKHFAQEEKIYACPHCNYTAGKSSYLRKHVAKHSTDKPFKCATCDYATAVATNLTKHMAVHEDEKAFPCPHCVYSATRRASMVKHVRKFHSAQSETGT